MNQSKKDLRIVFMGTPDFSVPALDILIKNSYNVVGVVTSPNKPAGRGKKIQCSAVKKYALEKKLNILQPENLKAPEFADQLKALETQLIIVVAFRMLPEVVWSLPKYGTFNLHASLLPQYRGAAPINHAIINGEEKTGVTTFFIEKNIDTGEIIAQEEVKIEANETAGSLHEKLMLLGAELVLKTVQSIDKGICRSVKQSEYMEQNIELKAAPKIFKDFCKIDWTKSVIEIDRMIRGLCPYPAAWTILKENNNETAFKLFDVTPQEVSHQLPLGSILVENEKTLKVATSNGFIIVNSLQPAGKKRMDASSFLNGYSIISEACFI